MHSGCITEVPWWICLHDLIEKITTSGPKDASAHISETPTCMKSSVVYINNVVEVI